MERTGSKHLTMKFDLRQGIETKGELQNHFERQFELIIAMTLMNWRFCGFPSPSEVPDLEVHKQGTRFLRLDSIDFVQDSGQTVGTPSAFKSGSGILPQLLKRLEAASWSFYICPPFSKGDAAFFAAGGPL
jgi:hypothetical protein